jgi:hypothetical protein
MVLDGILLSDLEIWCLPFTVYVETKYLCTDSFRKIQFRFIAKCVTFFYGQEKCTLVLVFKNVTSSSRSVSRCLSVRRLFTAAIQRRKS